MDDKLHLQLWTFDLFIVLTNFTLNVAMEIQIIFEIVYQCWNFAQKRSNFSPMILFIWILINKRYTQNYQLHTTKYADISKKNQLVYMIAMWALKDENWALIFFLKTPRKLYWSREFHKAVLWWEKWWFKYSALGVSS